MALQLIYCSGVDSNRFPPPSRNELLIESSSKSHVRLYFSLQGTRNEIYCLTISLITTHLRRIFETGPIKNYYAGLMNPPVTQIRLLIFFSFSFFQGLQSS